MGSPLFQQLAVYLQNSGFQEKLFDFLGEECSELVVPEEGAEQSLEMYQAYKKYSELFESEWKGFMEEIGASSLLEMQERLEKEMTEDEQSSKFYEGLLASMEYPKFALLVKDFLEADDEDNSDDEDEDEDGGEDGDEDEDSGNGIFYD